MPRTSYLPFRPELVCGAASLCIQAISSAQPPSFTILHPYDPGYPDTHVYALSWQGQVAVGGDRYLHPNFPTPTRWVLPQNTEHVVGYFDPLNPGGWATGVSRDGSVIGGDAWTGSTEHPFRWTQATGFQDLGDLPGGQDYAESRGLSGDGRVVVGFSNSSLGQQAFRWDPDHGIQSLGDFPSGNYISTATAASYDGSVIVGGGQGRATSYRAFRWTQDTGMTLLPVPFGVSQSLASAVSADGSVIVGQYNGELPAVWRNTQPLVLPSPPNTQQAVATGVSANGTIIVGYSATPQGDVFPLIWFSDNQWTRLDLLLASQGVGLGDLWHLEPTTISPDGTVVGGNAYDSAGHTIAWTAVIPGPSTLAAFGAGVLLTAVGRRRPDHAR